MKAALACALLAACSHGHGNGSGADAAGADAQDTGPPDAAAAAADPFPTGAISFYLATGCPLGWTPYADAAGRTLVSSATDTHVAIGTPLARNEVRAHHHDAPVGIDLPAVRYAGIAGAANMGVAAAGHVDATISTADSDPVLPYVQLLACRKTGAASATSVPAGLVAYFDAAACPGGWSDAGATIDGRVVVGNPTGGTAGATFGGAPLASGETRTHTHPLAATLALPAHGIALVSGCCADGYGAAGDRALSATTSPAAVELPYLQLRACTKD